MPFGKKKKAAKKDAEQVLTVRDFLAKARVLTGNAVDESQAIEDMQKEEETWGKLGATVPPYDPASLLRYKELSPHLEPNIASYEQNIEGYGFTAKPIESWMVNLDGDDATQAIENAIRIERWAAEEDERFMSEAEKQDEDEEEPPAEETPEDIDEGELAEEVTEEEVNTWREEIKSQMQREQFLFDSWFKNCCSEMSFTELRRITRGDYESHGWGAWEYLRDSYGRLKRLRYIPGYTVRPLQHKGEQVEVIEDASLTPLSQDREIMVKRTFPIYVQIVGSQKVYFKSPGDPRVVSRTTGKVYKNEKELRRNADADKPGEGKDAKEANELLYIAQHDPQTPCPPPRWIGNLLRVLGTREADETNYYYLNNNSIPPALLMISGGTIAKRVKERLQSRIKAELEGAGKNHRILVVEANGAGKPGERNFAPTMEFKSLREAQQSDALFTKYDERSADSIGASFRLPPLLRGYTPSSLNRATAIASMHFAEQQVFQPEREKMDWIINKYIMPEIGIRYLRFESNSPPTKSAEELSDLIKSAAPYGGMIPAEIREVVGDILNRPLTKLDDEWVKIPMPMTLAGLGGAAPPASPEEAAQLRGIEERVASIVTAELRAAGYDMDVSAGFVDAPDAGADDGEEEAE